MKKEGRGVQLMKEDTIKAVHDDDIEEFFKSLDVYEDFISGKLVCYNCGTTITKENLYSIFPKNDEVTICCDNPECIACLFREGIVK